MEKLGDTIQYIISRFRADHIPVAIKLNIILEYVAKAKPVSIDREAMVEAVKNGGPKADKFKSLLAEWATGKQDDWNGRGDLLPLGQQFDYIWGGIRDSTVAAFSKAEATSSVAAKHLVDARTELLKQKAWYKRTASIRIECSQDYERIITAIKILDKQIGAVEADAALLLQAQMHDEVDQALQ
jgi:hypothetical protein